MPSDSNWNTPFRLAGGEELVGLLVAVLEQRGVDLLARLLLDHLHAAVDERERDRPRKSILRRPISSTPFMSNWVTTDSVPGNL